MCALFSPKILQAGAVKGLSPEILQAGEAMRLKTGRKTPDQERFLFSDHSCLICS